MERLIRYDLSNMSDPFAALGHVLGTISHIRCSHCNGIGHDSTNCATIQIREHNNNLARREWLNDVYVQQQMQDADESVMDFSLNRVRRIRDLVISSTDRKTAIGLTLYSRV